LEPRNREIREIEMAARMLCTDCLHLGEPDTLLDGSDRVEMLAWACLALPGLIYCWWRHLGRRKLCSLCGGDSLMRESRAAASRRMPSRDPFGSSRILASGRALPWPDALGSPRGRLRSGGLAACASAFALVAWLIGTLDPSSQHAREAAGLAWLVCASWLAWQTHHMTRARTRWLGCEACDESGRRLPIEPA
jgi:hypothetical protein